MRMINLKLSDEQKVALAEEVFKSFESQSKTGFAKGVFEFKCELTKEKVPKAQLHITPKARDKMYALVDGFDSEVAWYMQCTRDENEYTVHDVYVYPQKVSSAYVEMDMDKYPEWDISLPPDISFNGQGHSHHTMAVSPSSTDKDSQKSYVGYLNGRGFYIFCILNRKRDENWWIYDLDSGVVYDPEDINVIRESGYEGFVNEAKPMVGKITPTYTLKTDGKYVSGGSSGKTDKTANYTGVYDYDDYAYGGYNYGGYYSKSKKNRGFDFEEYQKSLDRALESVLYD